MDLERPTRPEEEYSWGIQVIHGLKLRIPAKKISPVLLLYRRPEEE